MKILGAHVSISGGIGKAPARGASIGCDAIQIFTKNQVQWKAPSLTDEDVCLFKEDYAKAGLKFVVVHDSYLINLASPDPKVHGRSLDAFTDELNRAEQIGAPYLVFHPGAHLGDGEEAGLRRIAISVNRALRESDTTQVSVLFETTAGQGTMLGYSFEQLASLVEMSKADDRVGVCLDSCHIFAAGYEIRTAAGYERTMQEFDHIIGLDRLRALHLNDSRRELGSRVDRHRHIGEGHIGLEGFKNLLNDDRLDGLPMLLETPGKPEDFKQNLDTLRGLIS